MPSSSRGSNQPIASPSSSSEHDKWARPMPWSASGNASSTATCISTSLETLRRRASSRAPLSQLASSQPSNRISEGPSHRRRPCSSSTRFSSANAPLRRSSTSAKTLPSTASPQRAACWESSFGSKAPSL